MPDVDALVKKIIPGISFVPTRARELFFASPEGDKLHRLIESGHFDPVINRFDIPGSAARSHRLLDEKTRLFRQSIQQTGSFLQLKQSIVQGLLSQYYFEYQLLDDEQQRRLANTPYSDKLYQSWIEQGTLPDLQRIEWFNTFRADAQMQDIFLQMDKKCDEICTLFKDQIGFLVRHRVSQHEQFKLAIKIYFGNLTQDELKACLMDLIQPSLNRNALWQTEDLAHMFDLSGAFSWVASNIIPDSVKNYMRRIADAHTFYQFMGLSREGGGWQIDYLDLFRYGYYEESISTLIRVLGVLSTPHRALFHEYSQIAEYEKNMFAIMFRALVPVIIVGISFVFLYSLIVPFALHELLEIFMLVPALYIAMAIASGYVELKNYVFASAASWWWGVYKTPEFLVEDNPRMLQAFDEKKALVQAIADFYINGLKECDRIDAEFAKNRPGTLTTEQRADRQGNQDRKSTLLREWYDIHTNEKLGTDKITPILLKRLYEDGCAEYHQLKQDVSGYIDEIADGINKNKPARGPAGQWSFFSPGDSLKKLGQQCAAHQHRIDAIEAIYREVSTPGLV